MHIMQSHHNINIARQIPDSSRREGYRTEHFFRVLVEDPIRAKEVARELTERFAPSNGYEITVTEWQGSGRKCDLLKFIDS